MTSKAKFSRILRLVINPSRFEAYKCFDAAAAIFAKRERMVKRNAFLLGFVIGCLWVIFYDWIK